MSTQNIILEDLRGEYWTGALVEPEKARMLEVRGVTTLPVVPELFHHGAIGGFFRRDWGAGWLLPTVPGACAPLVLYVVPGLHTIHWCAKLVPTQKLRKEMEDGKKPSGLLRLVADGGQAGSSSGGLSNTEESVVDLSKLGELRQDGTWLVHARALMNAPSPLLIGFSLYGHAREVRVVWAAISQTE